MVRDYKCPSCGAAMVFESNSQKMRCEHCGTELTVEELEEIHRQGEDTEEEKVYSQAEHEDDFGKEKADFKKYTCPGCGAEILTDEHTAAAFCSYCGTPGLMEDRLNGEQTPAQIIPFKIDRQRAEEIYRSFCKRGVLTPKDFTKASTIEKISGIYVPFWLYDYRANAKIEAKCTKVRVERRGDMEYTHTKHFRVHRDVSDEYLKVPADASEKMPDDIMEKLEPFQYQDMVEFRMPYLSGYMAEKYNYTSEEMAKRVEERIYAYILEEARRTIKGYSTTAVMGERVHIDRRAAKYTMFPVWILNYRYKEKNYVFAINGQTGKFVGKLPISMKKAAGWFAGVSAAAYIILMLAGGIL